MADLSSVTEVGFAEFVSRLLSETFTAVVAAQTDQQERYQSLLESARLDPDAFAAAHVDEDAVNDEAAALFPAPSAQLPHGAAAGAPYVPADDERAEAPPIAATLGLDLRKGQDFTAAEVRGVGFVLTEAGAERIAAAMARRIAVDRLGALAEIARVGVPRVVVDAGRVNAKLSFQVTTTEESDEAEAAQGRTVDRFYVGRLDQITLKPQRARLDKLRLLVRQADERAPQSSTVKANVYGEVEVTFKTVT